jgi:hypothetical protein
MKKIIHFVLLSLFPLAGMAQTIGYDLDKNGCNKAAGLTYSKLKKECIQPFNQPIMVVSVNDGSKSYSTQTPLIFSEDQKKVEVFLPDSDKTVILKQKKNGTTWKKCGVQVDKVENGYEVRQKGKLIYATSSK